MVACSSKHFLQSPTLPRVLHKLTLCVYPWCRISQKAEEITKLTNEILEEEHKFSKNVGELLRNFIQHLQTPCCLIAHNGDKFDFPILRKELESVGVELPDSLMAADSLPIFRKIDLEEDLQKAEASFQPIDSDLNEDEQNRLKNVAHEYESKELADNSIKAKNRINIEASSSTEVPRIGKKNQLLAEKEVKINQEVEELGPDEVVAVKSKNPEDFQKHNETTPKLKRFPSKSDNIPSTSKQQPSPGVTPSKENPDKEDKGFDKIDNRGLKRKTETKRSLFSKNFKLTTIYEHYYNEPPTTSHYAEADVFTLMKCAIATRQSFARLLSTNAVPFNQIKDNL